MVALAAKPVESTLLTRLWFRLEEQAATGHRKPVPVVPVDQVVPALRAEKLLYRQKAAFQSVKQKPQAATVEAVCLQAEKEEALQQAGPALVAQVVPPATAAQVV